MLVSSLLVSSFVSLSFYTTFDLILHLTCLTHCSEYLLRRRAFAWWSRVR